MAGRYSARRIDGEAGRVERRFRETFRDDVAALQEPGGASVSIEQLLTDPNSVAQYEQDDSTVAVTDDAAVTLTLTHLPIPESLIMFQNGVRLAADEFTRAGQVVTVAPSVDVIIRAGQTFSAWYVWDTTVSQPDPVAPTIDLVGVNSAVGNITSITLPPGTQAGDLIVVGSAAYTSNGTTDPRLLNNSINGAGILVAWGPEDGTGDPIALTPVGTSGWCATTVAVYRGVQVADFDITQVAASPMVFPTFADAYAAIGVLTMSNSFAAGGLGDDSTLEWAEDVDETATKSHASINHWASSSPVTSPAGSFPASGTIGGGTQTTLLLEATP